MNSFIEASQELHKNNKYYGKASEYKNKASIKYKLTIPKAIAAADRIQPIKNILDHGCGQGGLIQVLNDSTEVKGIAHGYDPAIEKFKTISNNEYDLVISVDVLEHVGREHIDATLTNIKQLTKGFFFFCIDLIPANKKLANGRNAHVLLAPPDWWTQQIKIHFKIITAIETGEMPDGSSCPLRLIGCATNSIKNFEAMTNFLGNVRIANKKWIWNPENDCIDLR